VNNPKKLGQGVSQKLEWESYQKGELVLKD
jgi:hypothetical protein